MLNSEKHIEAANALSMMTADAPAASEKSASFFDAWKPFATGQDMPGANKLYPRSPYEQSLWVYRCVKVIADNAAKLPVMVSRGEALGTRAYGACKRVRVGKKSDRRSAGTSTKAAHGNIIESHPFIELLRQPNPEQTWSKFFRQTVALTTLTGRCLWLFGDMTGMMVPLDMYAVGVHGFKPEYDETNRIKKLLGWYVSTSRGNRIFVPITDGVEFTSLNPLNPHEGLSATGPARMAISADYQASRYNAAMFGNNAEPGGLLKTAANYDRNLDENMRLSWAQRHAGVENARNISILWGDMAWESVASTMQEMQFESGKKLCRTEICAAFGVPEVVAGFYTDANYGFAESGRGQFYEDTLLPQLDEFAEGLQVLADRYNAGLEVWFDAESSPTVQKLRNSNLDAITSLWSKGVPLADLNELYDLGLPDQPQHKVGFLAMGLSPAAEVAAGGMGADLNYAEGDDDTEEQPEKTLPRTKRMLIDTKTAEQLWKNWMQSWQPLAREMRNHLRQRLLVQERKLQAAIKGNVKSLKADNSAIIGRILLDVFGNVTDKNAFRAKVAEYVTQANMLGAKQALKEAGLTAEQITSTLNEIMASKRMAEYIKRESVRVAAAIDDRTRNLVKNQLAQGLDAGEDIRKLADRVQSVMGNRRTAAMTIARNSVGSALSESRQAGQQRAGMTHKIWMHSRGPGERRDEHISAEKDYASSPIKMSEPFFVGGEWLKYPRDPQGSPKNVINCQCVTIATRAASAAAAVAPLVKLARELAAKGFAELE